MSQREILKQGLPQEENIGKQIWISKGGIPIEDEFQEVVNGPMNKPQKGGFWTSTYTPEADYISHWMEWVSKEGYSEEWSDVYLLYFPDSLDILRIDSRRDFELILDTYSRKNKVKGYGDKWLDFEAISMDGWDGIHLTRNGQKETKGTDNNSTDLYAWDTESVLWFDFVFNDYELLREHKA